MKNVNPPDDGETLQGILLLKRRELPPPASMDAFSKGVIARIQAAQGEAPSRRPRFSFSSLGFLGSWLSDPDRWRRLIPDHPLIAGANAVILIGLALVGLGTVRHALRPASEPVDESTRFFPALQPQTAGAAFPSSNGGHSSLATSQGVWFGGPMLLRVDLQPIEWRWIDVVEPPQSGEVWDEGFPPALTVPTLLMPIGP